MCVCNVAVAFTRLLEQLSHIFISSCEQIVLDIHNLTIINLIFLPVLFYFIFFLLIEDFLSLCRYLNLVSHFLFTLRTYFLLCHNLRLDSLNIFVYMLQQLNETLLNCFEIICMFDFCPMSI